jgi:hypothetical protein
MQHKNSISSLHFLYPYPILISTCTGGFTCIWGMKPCPLDYRYKLIKKINNSLTEIDEEGKVTFLEKMSITSSSLKFINFPP